MLIAAERTPNGFGPDSFAAHAQQEIGFRVESGPWYFRLDIDTQFGSNDLILPLGGYWRSPPWSEPADKVKIGPPEWAMVQYSLDSWRFRGGIVTSMIGLEDWDPWINVFPTRGLNYNVTPGRTIGAEVSYVLPTGHEIFAFGGCDVDWGDCFAHDSDGDGVIDVDPMSGLKFGVGVTAYLDSYSTFSGISAFPNMGYYMVNLTGEIFAHEMLNIGYEAAGVLVALPNEAEDKTDFYASVLGGFTFNVLPAESIHPMFRAQGTYDPSGQTLNFYPVYTYLPDFMMGAGLTVLPADGMKISVEGKAQHFDVGWIPGVYTGITFVPFAEPAPYTAKTEEAPAEEAARRGRQGPSHAARGTGRNVAASGRR